MAKPKKVNRSAYKKAFHWIVRLLKQNNIKFNVLGGLAAYCYGSNRMLFDIDLSMSAKNMKKLAQLVPAYVVEKPRNKISSTSQWKGYYMELEYAKIAIEIGEAAHTTFYNPKKKQWEKFPDGLTQSANKKIFGLIVPVIPKKNLIQYKSKLNRKVDIFDVKKLLSA